LVIQVLPPLNLENEIVEVETATVISEDSNYGNLADNFDSAKHNFENLFGSDEELFPNVRVSRLKYHI
jgi:hypothetical protein